jgi:hypothetical protein
MGSIVLRREYTISREWTNEDRLDRIDLVVSSSSQTFVLAIENNVRAREHDEQTQRYEEWLRSRESLNSLAAGFFLSPAGFPPSSEWFKALSYLDLIPCIEEGALTSTPMPAEKIVLES